MKEIISAALLIVSLFAGTHNLKQIHDSVQKATLERAAQSLPSHIEMNRRLRTPKRAKQKSFVVRKEGR